jgi:hypothetical protein
MFLETLCLHVQDSPPTLFQHEDGSSTFLENIGKLYLLALRHNTEGTFLFIITESSNRREQSCPVLQRWFLRTVHTLSPSHQHAS